MYRPTWYLNFASTCIKSTRQMYMVWRHYTGYFGSLADFVLYLQSQRKTFTVSDFIMGINLHAVDHLLPLHPFLLFCIFFFCFAPFSSGLPFFVLFPAVSLCKLCGIGPSLLCHCLTQEGNSHSYCMSNSITNDLVTDSNSSVFYFA